MDKLIVFEAGLQDHREYWLKSLSQEYRLILVQPWNPTWEKQYIDKYIECSFREWSSERERLVNLLKSEEVKGIICLNEGTVNFSVDLQSLLNLPKIHQLENSLSLRNKKSMRTELKNNDLLSPKVFTDIEDIIYPVIIKPSEFMASLGVTLAHQQNEIKKCIELARTIDIPGEDLRSHYGLSEEVVIEEYIEGEEFSLECFVQNGSLIEYYITKKIKVSPPLFYETGHIANAETSQETKTFIKGYLNKIIKCFKLQNGMFHVEIIIKDNSIYTVEIAARPGGDMIPYLYMLTEEIDYPKVLAKLMSGNPVQINDTQKQISSCSIFFPFGRNISSNKLQEKLEKHECTLLHADYDPIAFNEDLSVRHGSLIMKGEYRKLLSLVEDMNRECSNVV